jgi:diketogulonate reductase-like aldo/keto reductase
MRVPKLQLNAGGDIPVIGFGTWQLKEGDQTYGATLGALQAGYRLIDTAKIYANERSVGKAIAESGIKREQIFVTTKLWPSDFDYVAEAFKDSLERLGLKYLDLYLIHWPNGPE